MKKNISLALLGTVLAALPAMAGTGTANVDCNKLALSVKKAVMAERSKVLEIVSNQVSAAPGCACEIVKASIQASGTEDAPASADTVAAIVEAAAVAAPEQLRLISQCAVAVAPDSLARVQAVLFKLDPQSPLNFPGQGPVAPKAGSPGGTTLIPFSPPIIINPVIVTNVNPPG